MDYTALVAYFVAVLAFTASPGPLIAVLVARSVGNDQKGALAFAAGLCVGDAVVLCAVMLGLGTVAQTKPELFALLKYAGIVYLMWLAFRIWNSAASNATQPPKDGVLASFSAGFALCVGTPSIFLSYMLFLPMVLPTGAQNAAQFGLVVVVTSAAVVPSFIGAVLIARQLKRVTSSPTASSLVSRITAGAIAATALWMLAA